MENHVDAFDCRMQAGWIVQATLHQLDVEPGELIGARTGPHEASHLPEVGAQAARQI
jgi:hypothetical protein